MSVAQVTPDPDPDEDDEVIPLLHQRFPRVRPPPKKKLEEFIEESDIEVITGKFSAKEDKRIKRNFAKFLQQYNLTDSSVTRCALLGFTMMVGGEEEVEELRKIKPFVKKYGFYYWLARKLPNRLISAVYNRARKLLHPFRKQSELTQSEKTEIIETAKSMTESKNIFAKIGNIYYCTPRAVQKIIETHVNRENKMKFNKGRWSPLETLELIQGICEFFEINVDELTTDHLEAELPWVDLSKRVVTRCPDSCREHILTVIGSLDSIIDDYRLWVKGDLHKT